jgi:AcrR family transcriptional regulator
MGFKETILNEALDIFEQRGIEAVSPEMLNASLGISGGTLRGIAPTRQDLVQLCITHSLQIRQAKVEQVLREVDHPLEAFLQILRLTIAEVHSFSSAFVQDLRDHYPRSWARLELALRLLSRDYLQPLLTKCIAAGYLQQDLPPQIVVRLFINQIQGLLTPQLFPAAGYGYQELFKILVVYYLRGCATPLGQGQLEAYTDTALSK